MDGLVEHLIYSHEQRGFYKTKPLFRALVIIIEGETELGCTIKEAAQSLVRTGVTTDLSDPISFSRFDKEDEATGPFVEDTVLDLFLVQTIIVWFFPRVNCCCFVAEVLEVVEG
jgi:hypothetical protein